MNVRTTEEIMDGPVGEANNDDSKVYPWKFAAETFIAGDEAENRALWAIQPSALPCQDQSALFPC
jgi:hypothetical protein